MALRVLLADESVTIKKVIQLALQDFAVEVKAVPVGLDVLEVSKSFQPDLVFADILLQKRSGYEVCSDLKKDPQTAAIPVVLMWSSFMELDQRQVDSSGADGRLEKPFEVEALRKLVLELVPRTRSQRLAHFLEYPTSVNSQTREAKPATPPPTRPPVSMATSVQPPARPEIPKPKMPPPLANATPAATPAAPATPSALSSKPKAPAANPFGSNFGGMSPPTPKKPSAPPPSAAPSSSVAKVEAPVEASEPGDLTPTPGIPDRPAPPVQTEPAPLGALPDLQLEGVFESTRSGAKATTAASTWNMDSFEPLDLAPLSLTDDDESDKEAFQPIQLPQAEPAPTPATFGAALSLTSPDDDDDAEADQWANRSLDKYRLPPLKPDESLAVDDITPDFASPAFEPEAAAQALRPDVPLTMPTNMPSLTTDQTEIIAPNKQRQAPAVKTDEDEVPEFTLSSDDFDRTSNLEIEPVDQTEQPRPEIVRELLRDPDFSLGDETVRQNPREKTQTSTSRNFEHTMGAMSDGVIDLSRAGQPAYAGEGRQNPLIEDNSQLEAMVRDQVAPQLEKVIEKIVAQLLPQIAERIIKRELERLLEES